MVFRKNRIPEERRREMIKKIVLGMCAVLALTGSAGANAMDVSGTTSLANDDEHYWKVEYRDNNNNLRDYYGSCNSDPQIVYKTDQWVCVVRCNTHAVLVCGQEPIQDPDTVLVKTIALCDARRPGNVTNIIIENTLITLGCV